MEKRFKLICLIFVFHILATHSYAATVVEGPISISPGLTGGIINRDDLALTVVKNKIKDAQAGAVAFSTKGAINKNVILQGNNGYYIK